MCNVFQIQLRLGLLLATCSLVLSCYITNCPKGGKRAKLFDGFQSLANAESNECTPCGPGGLGTCVAKNICCGEDIGCLMSPRFTKVCRSSTNSHKSCLPKSNVPTCGLNGKCRGRFLCCIKSKCFLDMACELGPSLVYNAYSEVPLKLQPPTSYL